jgi:hypothetical protein
MEKTQKHTPAPWFYTDEKSNLRQWSKYTIYAKKPDIVSETYGTFAGGLRFIANIETQPSKLESEANARLIAAAPKLLAACLLLVEEWDGSSAVEQMDFMPAISAAREAINKATTGGNHE